MAKIFILIALLSHLLYAIVLHSTIETIQESNTNSNNYNDDACGITSYYTDSTNSLIPDGEIALPGQWPWVVTIFFDKDGFMCAGSILTNRHILTVAACVDTLYIAHGNDWKITPMYPNTLWVALGQFKLRRRGSRIVGTVKRRVASYKIHPGYGRMNSDLAILTLRSRIEYSPFIRPICLWSGSTNLQNVVGRTGYIVGFPSVMNERDDLILISEPRMLRISIVSQETCLRSDQNLDDINSKRTFCGSFLGESSPCFSEIGSGLVLFDNSTGHYHLRGILSGLLGNFRLCNVTKYVVYIDVAKYLPWIQQQIISTM